MTAAAMGDTAGAPAAGRIGPNAVLRVMEASDALAGPAATRALLTAAGLEGYLANPPETMVPETEVAALHHALFHHLGEDRAGHVARHAGVLTARYLMARRIPGWSQRLLRVLPAPVAGRLLLGAIARNAWTFAGSARFSYTSARPWRVTLEGCPLCGGLATAGPACAFYAATFEHLFRELVAPGSDVTEVACQALGAPACEFRIA